MNSKKTKLFFGGIITFIVIFMMNYIGSPAEDRLSRALMTAAAGVVGLGIGLWIFNRNKKDDSPHHFD